MISEPHGGRVKSVRLPKYDGPSLLKARDALSTKRSRPHKNLSLPKLGRELQAAAPGRVCAPKRLF